MKYISFFLLIFLVVFWFLAVTKLIGFKKMHTVKFDSSSVAIVVPSASVSAIVSLAPSATDSSLLSATPSATIERKSNNSPESTSSSFILVSPTASFLHY